jgi:hypothetical protein
MTAFDHRSWCKGMQRQGRKQMREYLTERGPEAARDIGQRFERCCNEWLAHTGHAVEGQPFVLRPIPLPSAH